MYMNIFLNDLTLKMTSKISNQCNKIYLELISPQPYRGFVFARAHPSSTIMGLHTHHEPQATNFIRRSLILP